MANLDKADLGKQMPAGFCWEPDGLDVLVIHHKRTGMRSMNTFIFTWIAIWTIASLFLLYHYLSDGLTEDGNSVPLFLLLSFWGADILVASYFVYLLCTKKTFRLDPEKFEMTTELLGFKHSVIFPRDSIRRFVQIKDGGEDEDSFPSWGSKVKAEKDITLIYRQPHKKSRWLGQVLAQWANVVFVEVPEK